MSNYPPGVTGNEPQITGEWPCDECDGAGVFYGEHGPDATCELCKGTGIYPEDAWPISDIEEEIARSWDKSRGNIVFDTDDEYLVIHTDFKIIGHSVVLRRD